MGLPQGFLFSQSSLQAFGTCPRKFELQYLQHLAWPAVKSEPAMKQERTEKLGAAFHRLAQQHLSGLPQDRLLASASANRLSTGQLESWWEAFMDYGDRLPPAPGELASIRKLPEVSLVMEADFGEFGRYPYRLIAKYDALALVDCGEERTASILDWKTWKGKPNRDHLLEKVQTQVYSYILVHAGAQYNEGKPFHPDQVEMIYWFAEYPDQPIRLPYTVSRYQQDAARLAGLIKLVEKSDVQGYVQSDDAKSCPWCVYRSLCDRGVEAGGLDGAEEPDDFQLDDVQEVPY
jgi:hypothetical protein